jgi:uncharacterized protein YjgD (DUF1641 family)
MNAVPQGGSSGSTELGGGSALGAGSALGGGSAELGGESREQLTALLERGPEIEYLLDTLGQILKRGPDIADNVNRAIGDVRGRVGGEAGGFDRLAQTIEKLERLSESPSFQVVLDRLQDPAIANSLEGLIGRLDRITAMLEALERLLVRAPQFSDNLNTLVHQLRDQNTGRAIEAAKQLGSIDPRRLVQLLNELFAVVESSQTQALLRSSVFLDQSVALVDEAAASALQATADAAAARRTTGIFGLIALIKEPDVQRTLQFGIAFARRFGRKLRNRHPA